MILAGTTFQETSPEEFELDLKVNWHRNINKNLFCNKFAAPKKIFTFHLKFLKKADYDAYVTICFANKGAAVSAVGIAYSVTGYIRSEPPNIQWSGLNTYSADCMIEEI